MMFMFLILVLKKNIEYTTFYMKMNLTEKVSQHINSH